MRFASAIPCRARSQWDIDIRRRRIRLCLWLPLRHMLSHWNRYNSTCNAPIYTHNTPSERSFNSLPIRSIVYVNRTINRWDRSINRWDIEFRIYHCHWAGGLAGGGNTQKGLDSSKPKIWLFPLFSLRTSSSFQERKSQTQKKIQKKSLPADNA